MIRSSLRYKILLSVGIIIFLVLGTSTLNHVRNLRAYSLIALEERSEALIQVIISHTNDLFAYAPEMGEEEIYEILRTQAVQCIRLYELNKDKKITHFAVLDTSGMIAAHSDPTLQDSRIQSPALLDALEQQQQKTVLVDSTYHTLIPIIGINNTYLGTIDVGVSKSVVDERIQALLRETVVLFVIFLLLSFIALSLLLRRILTKPVARLASVGQQLAEGQLVRIEQRHTQGDEMARLTVAFNSVSMYLSDIAEIVSHIARGILTTHIRVRSTHDVLGNAVREMLQYLDQIVSIARKMAEGDLTSSVQVRSEEDAFGRVIQAMMHGLRTLIIQIRTSAKQIAFTGETITSLTGQNTRIVHNVNQSMEHVTTIMHEMDASVEEVSHNVESLSSSAEETSASVAQMTTTVTHIASQTSNLTAQAHLTLESLQHTLTSLESVVTHTDVSKEFTQDTIQNALDGQQAVEQVMTSMSTLQQTITSAVEAITRFEQRSQEIGTVLEVIHGITEQTSLLALNASIIAAQAGEYGRGFAVVADEIRDLADGVKNSATDIASIVNTLQTETKQVVRTIHLGVDHVNQGMEHTHQAQTTLQNIITSAERASSVVGEITGALHELEQTSHEVTTAMEQVMNMTDDITSATDEHQASTKQIHEAISQINDMAAHIQRATAEQLNGVHHVLEAAQGVAELIEQNLESSRQVSHSIEDLTSQSEGLLHSVEQFKVDETG